MRSRAFKFNFTIFTEETERFLQELDCRYIVYGYEFAPDTGRPHFEGYVYWDNPVSLDAKRKLFHKYGSGYFDVAKGSPIQNYNYSTKDGQFYERGVRPLTDSEKGQKEKDRWIRTKELAVQGKFAEIDADHMLRYTRNIERVHALLGPPPCDLQGEGELKVGLWIYGPPRTGKSRYVRENFVPLYLKQLNKWWCGYNREPYVLMEEMSPTYAQCLKDFLKLWCDRYVFRCETKGGTITVRPQRFIVTSNYSMEEVFGQSVDSVALRARFDVLHMPYHV